ncbi:MAG: hypothetical protein ACLGHY_10700 [Gammaproteobacteria bacterium]
MVDSGSTDDTVAIARRYADPDDDDDLDEDEPALGE